MRLTVEVRYLDGRVEVVSTRLGDLVAWEAWAGRSIATIGDDPRVSDLAYVAWRASTDEPRPPFEAWADTVAAVASVEEPAPDPTNPGRSPGPSSR